MDEQVTLTAYSDQIRDLIQHERNDEAIALCQHILRYYPKCVDVYSHLGQALLEKSRLADAKDVFRRVLSADPENMIAYVGLAVLLEQEQLIAEAVWHLERACELAPGHSELHQELQRLYHELDGRPRTRLKLTPGGLARLYMQEGLFAQAIQEWNAIVATDEKRFDARVALAQTQWLVGQLRAAAETAQALLQMLPYCLKANLILGVVWKEIGLAESEQYLQRAQELDPTNRVANAMFGARSPLPLAEPRVPRYVETVPTVPPAEAVVAAPVIEEAPPSEPPPIDTAVFQPPVSVTDTGLPPWLVTPSPEIATPAVEETGETPDWLARLRQTTAPPEEEIVAPSIAESEQLEAVGELETPALPEEESALPPWLAQVQRDEITTPVPEAPARAEELPPWLAQPVQPTEPARAEELPPWLAQPVQPTEPARAEELPSWLAQPVQPTEPARAEELPSWLAQPAQPTEPARAEELPPWIAQPAQPTEPARAEELPPWLAQPAQPTEPARAEEVPPWVAQPAQPTEPARAEEVPPWIAQPAQPTEPAREEMLARPVTPAQLPPAEARPTRPPSEPRVPARKRKSALRGESHLILARAYRDANQIAEALREYDLVVQKAPRLVNQVIADLQVLAQRPGVPLEVHRILGDAYTRADRLAEALAEYRLVLERSSSR